MLRLTELRLPIEHDEAALRPAVLRRLSLADKDLLSLTVFKRAADARKPSAIVWSYTLDLQVADEAAVLRRLKAEKVSLAKLKKGEARRDPLSEDLALAMGLLFKLLAPMRNVAGIENCARGIDAMAREEAAYWLGMAMHRKNPRRVLAALRLLLSAS